MLSPSSSPAIEPAGKKGVGFWNGDASFSRLSPGIDALGCSWYYNWTANPDQRSREILAEFVPMIWDSSQVNEENLNRVRGGGFKTLLGFNEPDKKAQANMSVEQSLKLWPRLMETGMRLGSPAPAADSPSKDWLARFMKGVEVRNLRVDFICLHWYGDVTGPKAVENLELFLRAQWERYQRPIWLTEFSGSTGSWLKLVDPPLTREKNAAFIRQALAMLESLPYLERYAWFEMKWETAPWARVALLNPKNGELTVTGQAYADSSNEQTAGQALRSPSCDR